MAKNKFKSLINNKTRVYYSEGSCSYKKFNILYNLFNYL